MKTIVVSLLLFLCIFGADSSQARKPDEFHGDSPNPFVFSCFNFGAGVSPSFTSCVNSNFKAFESRTDAFFLTCLNVSQEVDYSFVSCISSNFRSLSRALRGNVYLSDLYIGIPVLVVNTVSLHNIWSVIRSWNPIPSIAGL